MMKMRSVDGQTRHMNKRKTRRALEVSAMTDRLFVIGVGCGGLPCGMLVIAVKGPHKQASRANHSDGDTEGWLVGWS